MYDIAIQKKVRLLAMKTLLSAKFSEGKIIIVDNDTIPERKTKHVSDAINNFSETDNYVLLTSGLNDDFKIASENISRIKYVLYGDATITDLLKADKIMMTLDGVLNMMRFLNERTFLRHKPHAIKAETPMVDEFSKIKESMNPKPKRPQPEVELSIKYRNQFMIHLNHSIFDSRFFKTT